MNCNCYLCRYWARYPKQEPITADLIDPEYIKLMIQQPHYTDDQRKKVEDALKKFEIKGYCTYWKEDKIHKDTCSGFNPINIKR